MPRNIILVHGYSVRTLDTYGQLPTLLAQEGFTTASIFLSAFDSLNDDITCDDLANALEGRIANLEANGLSVQDTAFIVHSTGAIITRRWMLNRWNLQKPLPSHFISLAGANHGSTLAQLGTMQVVYLYRAITGGTAVGAEVLQDLDYGSEFLLQLNEEWLDAFNSTDPNKPAPPVSCFSLIGDDHSALDHQIFWQTHENGSDGTVRISSGNLNYKFASVDQNDTSPGLVTKQFKKRSPHLVLPGISHTGDNGILGGNAVNMQNVLPHINDALAVDNDASYDALAQEWDDLTAQWKNADNNTAQCNSTVVFSLRHPGGRKVEDSLILIKDQNAAGTPQELSNVGDAIEDRQPIQNDTTPSSVSFYLNYDKFQTTYPHLVHIEVSSGCDEINYPVVNYPVLINSSAAVGANEFAYVKVTLKREPQETYQVIPWSDNPNLTTPWPPLPKPAGS